MKTHFLRLLVPAARSSRLALACLAAIGLAQTQLHAQFGPGAGVGGNVNRAATSRPSSSSSYPSSTQMGTANVSVDPETRRVFVVTDDETAKQVKQVVDSLNQPPPQVLIKCVFLEATYTKDSDIGVQGIYSYTSQGNANHLLNGVGQLGSALSVPSQTGAFFTFNSLAQGLDVTISALATAGKTEVLSRPTILARNNQPASISLGQQVPLVTATRFDNYGNQINSITYQNVGIILNVTPFVTEQNMVEMIVSPQISQLADRSEWVPISGGTTNSPNVVTAPVINSRAADTVVVVPNAQTVVIGGLMQNTKLDSTDKVPILGDIPLLGALFRHKVTNNAKTELMIFMTPHIVRQPSDLAEVTGDEKRRTTNIPKAFTEEELNRALNDLPNNVNNPNSGKSQPNK
jgi:general secretion pathway protein D